MRPEEVKKSSRDVRVARAPAAGAVSLEDREPVRATKRRRITGERAKKCEQSQGEGGRESSCTWDKLIYHLA